MTLSCVHSREIDTLLQLKTFNDNINNIISYLFKKLKHLNLERVTDETKHMKFEDQIIPEKIINNIENNIEVKNDSSESTNRTSTIF